MCINNTVSKFNSVRKLIKSFFSLIYFVSCYRAEFNMQHLRCIVLITNLGSKLTFKYSSMYPQINYLSSE